MSQFFSTSECVSAIVPARNEQSVIAACVESLAVQKEIGEILVIDDQSSDAPASFLPPRFASWCAIAIATKI